MSKYFKSMAIAAAAICAASSANAAVITYTNSGRGPVFLQRFNPSLGTLQSVTFNNQYGITSSYSYTGDPSAPAPQVRITGTIGDPGFGQVNVDEVFQSFFSAPNQISVTINKAANPTFTTNLSAYTGSGSYTLGFYNLTAPGYAPTASGGISSTVSVTYTYLANVAAVPEPATWAMMLTGLGMVAGATRYRRRKTAIALG